MYKNNSIQFQVLKIATINKKKVTDFAHERNKILREAKAEWVFFVDSDEIVSKILEYEVREFVKLGYESAFIKRRNYFLGNYVGSEKIIRLVKKDSGNWERKIHEVFEPLRPDLCGLIREPLIHNTANNLAEYIKKLKYYSNLHALENVREGKRSGLFKVIFYPAFKFFATYLKSGNVVFSIMQSLHSFLAWSSILLTQRK